MSARNLQRMLRELKHREKRRLRKARQVVEAVQQAFEPTQDVLTFDKLKRAVEQLQQSDLLTRSFHDALFPVLKVKP